MLGLISISSIRHQARYNSMELGLILGRNLEKLGKRQNLGVFKVFQSLVFYFCRFPGFSRLPGNPDNKYHVYIFYITLHSNNTHMHVV